MKFSVILPADGLGTRMGGLRRKRRHQPQAVMLLGRQGRFCVHTVRKFELRRWLLRLSRTARRKDMRWGGGSLLGERKRRSNRSASRKGGEKQSGIGRERRSPAWICGKQDLVGCSRIAGWRPFHRPVRLSKKSNSTGRRLETGAASVGIVSRGIRWKLVPSARSGQDVVGGARAFNSYAGERRRCSAMGLLKRVRQGARTVHRYDGVSSWVEPPGASRSHVVPGSDREYQDPRRPTDTLTREALHQRFEIAGGRASSE